MVAEFNGISETEQRQLTDHVRRLEGGVFRLTLDPSSIVALIGALQLALRHPDVRGMVAAARIEIVKDACISILARGDKAIERLLRMGDDPRYDIELPADRPVEQREAFHEEP